MPRPDEATYDRAIASLETSLDRNFEPSRETEATLRQVMIAAGVTPPKTVIAKTQPIY